MRSFLYILLLVVMVVVSSGMEKDEEVKVEVEEGKKEEVEVGKEEEEKSRVEDIEEEEGEVEVEEEEEGEFEDDYDNMRIDQARAKLKKNKCEKKDGYCKLPSRGLCKPGYAPSNSRTFCDTKSEICCLKTNKRKCGVSSACKKKGGWCMLKTGTCSGKTDNTTGICGSKRCTCCLEGTAPSCNPERAICRKCGEAPIEVARLADDGTREVQVFKYDINGNVIGQDTRIIGGDKASPLEYPYQAALVKGSGLLFLCGASIITREWVLTAAHCLAPLQGDYSTLLVGVGNTFRDLMLYLDAKRVIIHEDYNDLRIEDGNDIALIQLPARLNFDQNPSVQPVCLAEAEDLVIGQDMVNTGWGLLNTSKNAISPNELYEVTLTQMDVKVCRRSGDVPRDQKKVICTVNTDKSSCKGDSGGPLVVQLCDGRWVQTGIVSYSIGLCSGINLFTSVPYYRDWIIDNIKPTYFC